MRDILKDAQFGEEFVTVRGWKAIYLGVQDPEHTDIHVLALAQFMPYRFIKKYNVHGRCADAMNGNGCDYDINCKLENDVNINRLTGRTIESRLNK